MVRTAAQIDLVTHLAVADDEHAIGIGRGTRIVGDEDEVTPPAQAKAMAEAIPGASLVVVRSAGHVPPVERPAETTDALLGFLAGLA